MKNLSFKLLALILFSTPLASSADIIYKPFKHGIGTGYFIADEEFQDVRTYSEDKKTVRIWSIRKGNLSIDQIFNGGQVQSLNLKQILGKKVVEISYERISGDLKLVRAQTRFNRAFFYSGLFKSENIKKEMCLAKPAFTLDLDRLMQKFDVDLLQANLSKKIIDPSCKRETAQYEMIEQSLIDVMSPENDFLTCLNRESTIDKMAQGFKSVARDEIKEELKMIGLKYSLQSSKFMSQPDSVKSKIQCKSFEGSDKPAMYVENGSIIFNSAKVGSAAPKVEDFKERAIHETLHDVGVISEGVVDNLINVCFGRPFVKFASSEAKASGLSVGSGTVFSTISQTQDSISKVAKDTPVAIPRTLAETAIPNPPASELNRPFANADSEIRSFAANPEAATKAAYTQSLNSTSGIINFAKSAVASFTTPVIAAPVQSRGLASVGSAPAAAYVAKSKSKVSNSDMNVIKEEILIGDNGSNTAIAPTKSGSGTLDQTAARSSAANKADVGAANENAVAIRSASSGSGSAFTGGGVSSGSGSIRSSGGGRSPASQRSSRNNGRSGTAAPNMNISEIQKTLINYSTAVRKLADPTFRRVLKENKVLIIDMTDKIVFDPGVPKGQAAAVFLDTGSSFVRGNKK